MKKLDRFSILAIVLTVLYILAGRFIMSDIYLIVYDYLFGAIFYLYIGCMGASVIVGMIGIIKTYKAQKVIKWGLLLLTMFNFIVLILNLKVINN